MLDGKTVIKCISTKYGNVSLIQSDTDAFVVRTEFYEPNGEEVEFSNEFKDFNMANWLFDVKAEEIGVIR